MARGRIGTTVRRSRVAEEEEDEAVEEEHRRASRGEERTEVEEGEPQQRATAALRECGVESKSERSGATRTGEAKGRESGRAGGRAAGET